MNYKKLFYGGVILLVGVVAVAAYLNSQNVFGKSSSEFANNASDLIGTKTGTTTAGVGFSVNAGVAGQSASTTYVVKTGPQVDSALLTFGIKAASSTANLQFSGLISNDDFCDTATTTTIYDVVTTGQVNWFDGAPFLDGHSGSQSLTAGTSTLTWDTSNLTGSGRSLLFTGLNSECLALQVSGSSTVVHAQIKVK